MISQLGEFADGQKIYHNLCRSHTGLPNGMTPAQSAGIDHNLGHNEIKDLIDKSAEVKYETNRDYDIEIQLGKRTKHVNIVREKDCTSIKPKSGSINLQGEISMIFWQ